MDRSNRSNERSIGQPIDLDWSMNGSIDSTIHWRIDGSIDGSIDRSMVRSIYRSMGQSIDRWLDRWSFNQSIHRSINRAAFDFVHGAWTRPKQGVESRVNEARAWINVDFHEDWTTLYQHAIMRLYYRTAMLLWSHDIVLLCRPKVVILWYD